MDRPYTHTTLRVKAGQEDEFVKRWTEWADWSHRQGLETEARLLRDAENPQTFVSFAPWKNVSTVRSWRGQKEFDRVLKQDPRHIQTLVFRGYLQGRQGRHDRALKDFSKALELNPNVVTAVIGRGWTYVMLKRYGEALADFQRALEVGPNNALALNGQQEARRLAEGRGHLQKLFREIFS